METREQKIKAAWLIQAARDLEDFSRATENIEWLSGPSPKFACGTPVGKVDCHELLKLNKANAETLKPKVEKILSHSFYNPQPR
jgi:hypothetical protein